MPAGAANTPTKPQKVLKRVDASNKGSAPLDGSTKIADTSIPDARITTLAAEKAFMFLGFLNQSELAMYGPSFLFSNVKPCSGAGGH